MINTVTVGKFEAAVSIPLYEVPFFGYYNIYISQVEEDKLLKGNILAIQGWSVVTYPPEGDTDYIITVRNEPYRRSQGETAFVIFLTN